MKQIGIMVMLAMFILTSPASANESATKDECVSKVRAAVEMAQKDGLEATFQKIQAPDSPFIWKDSYVYCVDIETGVVKAHPKTKLVGKNLRAVKDVTGKMFVIEYCALAKQKGEGWTTFMWPKPGEKKPSKKFNYVMKVPDTTVLFGAGYYE